MKSQILLVSISCLASLLSAQTFQKYPPEVPFDGVTLGTSLFEDIDGDGDEDVLIVGMSYSLGKNTKLYRNEGMSHFVELPQGDLHPVRASAAAFADVDGDQDQDVLIMGENESFIYETTLYLNDGSGNFSVHNGTPFVALQSGTINFSDVDSDLDQDVLITGVDKSFGDVTYTKLYLNDGTGSFTENPNSSLLGVTQSYAAFVDVDGDLDQDLLLVGLNLPLGYVAYLYLNDGNGNFELKPNTPFEGLGSGDLAFSDVDGDQDQDLVIRGVISSGVYTARLYLNDGLGNFAEVLPSPFLNGNYGSVDFADIDGDQDQDILFTGKPFTRLYRNDGAGNFSLVIGNPLYAVSQGESAFSDIDGDMDMDVIIMGSGSVYVLAKLYLNDGTGNFDEVSPIFYYGVHQGVVLFADIDGDIDPDLVYQGAGDYHTATIKLMINDGAGNFSEVTNHPLQPLGGGDLAFADVDGDNDKDLLIVGGGGGLTRIAKLYLNDGLGHFTEALVTSFSATISGGIAFSDVDSDQDQDVMIVGQNDNTDNIARLYLNDGSGQFTGVFPYQFGGIYNGSVDFADVNGDQLPDVLITGVYLGQNSAKLYLNNGGGAFSEQTDVPFVGVSFGDAAFADVDGDTDKDVLITGEIDTWGTRIAKLYLNDGTGHFVEDSNNLFEGVDLSTIAFSDLNNDGDLDLILAGRTSTGLRTTKWFTNDGAGHFTRVLNHGFKNVIEGSIATADVDGDDDMDVFIIGLTAVDIPVANLYLNEGGNVGVEEHVFIKKSTALLYPNPGIKGRSYLDYDSNKRQNLQISMLDLNGKTIFERSYPVELGLNTLSLEYSKIPSGMYWIRIVANGLVEYLTLVVE